MEKINGLLTSVKDRLGTNMVNGLLAQINDRLDAETHATVLDWEDVRDDGYSDGAIFKWRAQGEHLECVATV